MALTAKQKTDLATLKTTVNVLLDGHASKRITDGAAQDTTGTTGCRTAGDQSQRELAIALKRVKRDLDLIPTDSNFV